MREEKEIWRDIPGYEGYFKVSTKARILNMLTKEIRHPGISIHGYRHLVLRDGIGRRNWTVHLLVALTWCKRESDKHCEVHHKDFIKTNNEARNLMWVTPYQHKQLHKK